MRPLPLIVAGIVVAGMVPSIVMLLLAKDVRISRADPRPYQASAEIDGDHRAQARLRAAGFRYTISVEGPRVVATIAGTAPTDARLVLLRPDDPAADSTVAWPDTTTPLAVAPGRPGRWRVRLEGTVDGARARLAESAVDVGM